MYHVCAHVGNHVFDSPVVTKTARNTRGWSRGAKRRQLRHTLQGCPIGSVYRTLDRGLGSETRIKLNLKRDEIEKTYAGSVRSPSIQVACSP